jgi:hypothetical protein
MDYKFGHRHLQPVFFIVSKMVKILQFIATTLISINFNRKGR